MVEVKLLPPEEHSEMRLPTEDPDEVHGESLFAWLSSDEKLWM